MALLHAANHTIDPIAPRQPNKPETSFFRYLAP